NDTVATDEFRFGDNDTLAALVANLLEAETLIILTDQAGLYSDAPGKPDARLITQADAADASLDAMAGPGSDTGRGGMITKLEAARIAARSGANTVICAGAAPGLLLQLMQGEVNGTLLTAGQGRLVARKRWLANLPVQGRLHLDQGASRVLAEQGKSLLPVGVTSADGNFQRGDMVACLDTDGQEVARGLINYNAEEVAKLGGQPSHAIEGLLGYVAEKELIHRDNLVLFTK
ncbi:MAG: glutamate 5-kinase, partial [Pseudomonadales bacterium]